MASHPFMMIMQVVCAGSGTATLSYNVAKQEVLKLHKFLVSATGIFNIVDIRDSQGRHYTNASGSAPIPDTIIGKPVDAFNNLGELPIPLVLEGGTTLYVDVVDTSTATNTIKFIGVGEREYQ